MLVELLEGLRILYACLQGGLDILITIVNSCFTSNLWPLALIGLATAYIKKHAR